MRATLLCLVWLPVVGLAQAPGAESTADPGRFTAVQERVFQMSDELTIGIGVLPLDAYYKGALLQIGYTHRFSDSFGWQILRVGYSYNLPTSLTVQLQRDFGETINATSQVQVLAGSDLVWSPLYGKGTWVGSTVTHFEGFGEVGVSALNLGAGPLPTALNLHPAVNLGIGLRFFASRSVSWRVDLTDNIVFGNGNPAVFNVPTLQLSLAFDLGGGE